MQQTLKINTVITIPETHVLIEKEEYNRLRTNDVLGETGDSKWLEEKVNVNFRLFARKVLLPNKEELQGFVRFPDKTHRHWKFQKTKMSQWLDDNWIKWN